ncbi:hypothetical protein [Streptomyces somaliensis]|uniref:hypothetical protein n=1 Tax=Streptomyces somaliensis TaxID=78355 RepID=UPI0034E95B4B|nr:hypothetical protein [Streptomyces somaliensis]
MGGEFGAVAVADLDLGAEVLLQLLDERPHEVLVAAGVDDEIGRFVAAAGGERRGEQDGRGDRGQRAGRGAAHTGGAFLPSHVKRICKYGIDKVKLT